MGDVAVFARHGLPHSARRYRAGCRCLICTAAHQDDLRAAGTRRAKRARSAGSHGTAERAAGGWRCVPCQHARREAAS